MHTAMPPAADRGIDWWDQHSWTGSGEGRFNEDYALVSAPARCAILVDGATGLTKANLVPFESDAAWYARTLCELAVARLSDSTMPTVSALASAGQAAANAYRRFPGAAELARIDEPNGSVAVLRWDARTVEVAMLGDCTAVVGLRDGTSRVIYDDTLSRLDDENYERMYAYAVERGTTMAQARRALNPRFIENRLKMNEPGGYWAADLTCRGFAHVGLTCLPRHEVSSLFVCSDGYANAVTMGVAASFQDLAARAVAGEGVALGEELRAAEQADAGCWEHHRSKTSDDATYVALRLGPTA